MGLILVGFVMLSEESPFGDSSETLSKSPCLCGFVWVILSQSHKGTVVLMRQQLLFFSARSDSPVMVLFGEVNAIAHI